jgi:hypothetical protein
MSPPGLVVIGGALVVVGIWYLINHPIEIPQPPAPETDELPPNNTPQLKPRPKYEPRPVSDNQPTPNPFPKPSPNDCPKNCETFPYNIYDPLVDAIGIDLPFGGFKDRSLPDAISAMTNFRGKHSQIRDFRTLIPDPDGGKDFDFPQFKNPDGQAKHYNIFIKELFPTYKQSAGSIGRYKFCQEGTPPSIVIRFGILNIKDNPDSMGIQRKYY